MTTLDTSASSHAPFVTEPSDATVAELNAGAVLHVTVLSFQGVSLTWKSPPRVEGATFRRRSLAPVTERVPTPDTVNLIRKRTSALFTESVLAEPKLLLGYFFLIVASAVGVKVSVDGGVAVGLRVGVGVGVGSCGTLKAYTLLSAAK